MKVIDGLFSKGAVQLVELDAQALSWAVGFMERYATLGAQLADATLMFLAERERIDTVFTLDRRDFTVYRTTDGRALALVPDE
jgi:predicted nucleic acid-binding protein